MSIENVIYRIVNDPDFAREMAMDPAVTLESNTLELRPGELDALKAAMSVLNESENSTGAAADPTGWFVTQFEDATADPTGWFLAQFQNEIA
jgi:hypothetical protein